MWKFGHKIQFIQDIKYTVFSYCKIYGSVLLKRESMQKGQERRPFTYTFCCSETSICGHCHLRKMEDGFICTKAFLCTAAHPQVSRTHSQLFGFDKLGSSQLMFLNWPILA